MTEFAFCNSSRVSAAAFADCWDTEGRPERVVTLAMGVTHDDGSQEILTGMTLSPEDARLMAQDLPDAAAMVESSVPLPQDVAVNPPMGSC